MHLLALLTKLPYVFTTQEVAKLLKVKEASADKLCQRYVRSHHILRLKKGLYIFFNTFLHLDRRACMELATRIRPDSYVSFSTALSYFRIMIAYPSVVESVNLQRSYEKQVGHLTYKYHRLPKKYFFSYMRQGELKIATPEKALLDLLYLYSLGRYEMPLRKINLEALNLEKLLTLAEKFPPRTRKMLKLFLRRSGSTVQ